jgi:hypothetical protein
VHIDGQIVVRWRCLQSFSLSCLSLFDLESGTRSLISIPIFGAFYFATEGPAIGRFRPCDRMSQAPIFNCPA